MVGDCTLEGKGKNSSRCPMYCATGYKQLRVRLKVLGSPEGWKI